MSATNRTAGKSLSQFVDSDKPSWLGDYNGDMAKIDAAVTSLESQLATANATIVSLQSQMAAVITKIGGIS